MYVSLSSDTKYTHFKLQLNPEQYHFAIHEINYQLSRAFNPWHAVLDHLCDIASFYTLTWFKRTYFEKRISELEGTLNYLNYNLFNPAGLNILNPSIIGFLYLEIEYY